METISQNNISQTAREDLQAMVVALYFAKKVRYSADPLKSEAGPAEGFARCFITDTWEGYVVELLSERVSAASAEIGAIIHEQENTVASQTQEWRDFYEGCWTRIFAAAGLTFGAEFEYGAGQTPKPITSENIHHDAIVWARAALHARKEAVAQ